MSMAMGSEKSSSLSSSRLFSYLLMFSMLLLISSSLTLLEFYDSPLLPESVLHLIRRNKLSIGPAPNVRVDAQASVSPIPNAKANPVRSPSFPNQTSENVVGVPCPPKCVGEPEAHSSMVCDKSRALLRVYMYDLDPKFHFGMLGWKGSDNQTWPSVSDPASIPHYPGSLNLQHSPEFWLTLDVLASETDTVVRPCSAIRVHNSSDADIVFVPFFSSLSYNRHSKHRVRQRDTADRVLQEELVEYLKRQEEWRRRDGRDHVVLAHHPNSMLFARKMLSSCMFVLSDFGRYPSTIANLEKDVIAPYKHMVRTLLASDSAPFDQRQTLVYFQGAIFRKDGGVIRQQLYNLLKGKKDVHFKFGSVRTDGVSSVSKGMASSKFCLNIAGDTPSSNRLFDAIASHCVPVIISDEIELPYEDILDYSEFSIFVRAQDAVKKGYLLDLIRGIKRERWTKMWETMKNITGHFEYQYPSQSNDAVEMIWQTIARKRETATMMSVHRKNRYSRSQLG